MTLDNRQLLILQFIVNLIAWSAVGVALVAPRLARLDGRRALRWLIAPQMFRIIGMTLLATGVAGSGLAPEFKTWVAYGDLATSILAIAAFTALARPGRLGLALAATTTAWGAFDLLHNLALGMQTGAADHLGSAWIIPSTLVPLMLVLHVGAAVQLFRSRRSG